jgi:hypothetical protein
MNLFRVEHLPPLQAETATMTTAAAAAAAEKKKQYDKQQYDARLPKLFHSRLNPSEAAELLQRTDDDVDFQMAWAVIREMAGDAAYRDRVLLYAAAAAAAARTCAGGPITRTTTTTTTIRQDQQQATKNNVNVAVQADSVVAAGILQ